MLSSAMIPECVGWETATFPLVSSCRFRHYKYPLSGDLFLRSYLYGCAKVLLFGELAKYTVIFTLFSVEGTDLHPRDVSGGMGERMFCCGRQTANISQSGHKNHCSSCVFQKNVVPLRRKACTGVRCMDKCGLCRRNKRRLLTLVQAFWIW